MLDEFGDCAAMPAPKTTIVGGQKMLVLSTGHLREATCNTWLAENCPWVRYPKGDVGWFMYACDDNAIFDTPNELRVVINFTREHDCTWIMFDEDGPIQPGLVVYDW